MLPSSQVLGYIRHNKFKYKFSLPIRDVPLIYIFVIIISSLLLPVDSKPGDSCITSTGHKGICKAIAECPSVGSNKQEMLSTPFCRWDGFWPLYCCPQDNKGDKQENQPMKNRFINLGCGKRQGPKTRFVAGGKAAERDSWPWMAAIFIQYPGKLRKFHCGGSLISPRYILTAAHCLLEAGLAAPQWVTVLLGAHNFRDGKIYAVEQIILHEGYKSEERYHDIALLRLRERITYNQTVLPVCLPSPSDYYKNYTNVMATVTGWGGDSYGGIISDVLRQVTLPIVSNYECNKTYSRLRAKSLPHGITDSLICAGLKEGGKDACQSDSGGPLVIPVTTTGTSDERWVIVGVVSFGFQCAIAGYPGVYSRVSYYMNWIKEKSGI